MPQYFFILGRNPELSLAELHAVLPPKYRMLACSREVLVVECAELEVEQLMRRLGGTVKMGRVLSRNTYHVTHNTILEVLGEMERDSKKLFLGLSAYALDNKVRLPSVRELREMGIGLKRELQAQGHKVRLVTSREIALSSVIVKKEKLLSQGTEFVLLYGSSNSQYRIANSPQLIGRTLVVQEFEEASIRDFGRPVREMKIGMLPIQLAKIMINLARAPQSATLLDPFCGFGTILSEAALMGYRHLLGSDLEQLMIEATRKNLKWLGMGEGAKLIASSVERLSKHLPPHSVDAIVTEPYLGPTRHGNMEVWKHETKQLIELYTNAFCEFSKILRLGGRVVFIMPVFKRGTALTKLSSQVLPQIKKMGFHPTNLLPSPYPLAPGHSITYSRPSQSVLREIFVLEFKPQT